MKQFVGFLKTPPLWNNIQFGLRQFEFPDSDLTGFTPTGIPQKLRLGHQMEHVFKQLVDASSQYTVLIHNLPIKANKRTVGEIDFILKDKKTEKVLHVELTYKFYIIDTHISEPVYQLMGPNKRDMFFTKMEKIKTRQFPLLHTVEGMEALNQNGIDPESIEHQCCFKAQLFIPYGKPLVHIRPLNKACVDGYWIRFDDFKTQEFRGYSYYIPYKLEWVVLPHNDVPWQSHFEISMEINLRMIKENAPMVWIKKSDEEFEKFFVVWW